MLVLEEKQLRKYFECSEWYAQDKILSKYVSPDTQNRLNQKAVEPTVKHPDTWDLNHYTTVLKSPNTRNAYIAHLKSLGYVKQNTESGILCYVKKKHKENETP